MGTLSAFKGLLVINKLKPNNQKKNYNTTKLEIIW